MWSWTLLLEPSPCMRCVSAVWCVQSRVGLTREGNEGEWLWVIVWLLLTLWVEVASFLYLIFILVCYNVLDHCDLLCWDVLRCVEMCWDVLGCVEKCWDVLRCVDGRWNVDLDHNWSLPQHGRLVWQLKERSDLCAADMKTLKTGPATVAVNEDSRNVTIIVLTESTHTY